ncbi:snRNA-activating protein complex subunit 3 [Parasteatoda tepidariorum]|uniref:snRNA-activating protein complex subunit 3 n=1 Tax=Parasteatoda tepidariorum TaxID=114398 RepID=UPI00077FC183|nr:snRNA-activating protein complex subunit 3 [Parasteatoda tepidariorum]
MENVHKTATRPWISKPLSVQKFLTDWMEILNSETENFPELKSIMSEEEFSKVEQECSTAAMKCPNQHVIELCSADFTVPDDVDLETVRLQQEELTRRKNDPQYDAIAYNSIRFHNYPLYQNSRGTSNSEKFDFVPVKEPDVVLTVQIFRPEKRYSSHTKNAYARFPIFHVDQEFLILGSQYLTELRDRIQCVSDKAIPGDYSENPFQNIEITCKDLHKSGFFYIDGIFYNDMRHPDCRDYSDIIMKWSESAQRGIGPFQKRLMEKTKFIDLNLQLGYPYVYVHQGNCEHFIVFSDLMLFGSHHNNNRNEYPLYTVPKPKKCVVCMVCHIHIAAWIVFNNQRVPETPFYFCKSCFFSFNYDEDGKKIGEFEAYHHIDRSTIL